VPPCPRNERTSRWTYRKTIDSAKGAKQKAGSYVASGKIKDSTFWRGRPTQKITAHRAETGNMETPAPTAIKKEEKRKARQQQQQRGRK
jgi:hypothetical protein